MAATSPNQEMFSSPVVEAQFSGVSASTNTHQDTLLSKAREEAQYAAADAILMKIEAERRARSRASLTCRLSLIYELLRVREKQKERERRKIRKQRRMWVRPWIERRKKLGGEVLLRELQDEDPESFTNALRMNSNLFDELLAMVEAAITKEDTVMRRALAPRLKLQITLRYLATGDSLKSLQYLFRVPHNTISVFLPEVLRAIYAALSHYIKVPQTLDDWDEIATLFAQVWNFPRCCGAIDGKHIAIKAPPASGSHFYNYKGYHSTVLFAMVDADYNFTYINVGTNGRSNDAGIFQDSALFDALESGNLNLPPRHVILGDSAFPLKEYLMKPFPYKSGNNKQTIFNYRLSRARRIVENAFGILAWRFRVFSRPIELKVETADAVVLATCALHNWLRSRSPSYLTSATVDQEDENTGEIIMGHWRNEITALQSATVRTVNNYTQTAKLIRNEYADYFWKEGAIPAQWKATGINPADARIQVDNNYETEVDNTDGDDEDF